MGCGTSIQVNEPASPRSPAPAVPDRTGEETPSSSVAGAGQATGFVVSPEPHAEFLPSLKPSPLEVKCRSIVAQLAPRKSEESAQRELAELIQQWENSGQLADIESYSLSAPASLSNSINKLSEYLTQSSSSYAHAVGSNELHLQVAKAYCIYAWVAKNIKFDGQHWQAHQSQDSSSLEHSTQAEKVLKARMTVSLGYANLFKSLASVSGLKAEVIQGNLKDWQSRSSSMASSIHSFQASSVNAHAWNLISLGGVSYPVDCTMGSGFVSTAVDYQQDFTHHYFAVPPQDMVLTHWPQKANQQLLRKPLSSSEFQPLIPLSSRAVGLGIYPDTWSEVIDIPAGTPHPVVSISMACKADTKVLTKLSMGLEHGDNNELSHCVFVHREGDKTSIRAVVPGSGQYVLDVYASSTVPNSSYQVVLSYTILCNTEIGSHLHIGYPTVYNVAANAFDFQILHWNKPMPDYCCDNSVGKLDIVFRAKPDLQFFHYIVSGDGQKADDLNNACHYNTIVAQNKSGDPSLHILRSVFPSQGSWTVCLCATKTVDSNSHQPTVSGYTTIFKYNVHAKSAISNESFPYIKAPYINVKQPETVLASGNEILNVQFCSSKVLDFYSYLTFEKQRGQQLESYTQVLAKGVLEEEPRCPQLYDVGVIFPKPGNWYVHVCGRDNNQQKYTELFSLRLEVKGALNYKRFPKLDSSVANALNFNCYETGSITFHDDGSPFTYKFRAPSSRVEFVPSIAQTNVESSALDEEYLKRCTLLSHSVENDRDFSVYTVNVVFPSAGAWSVQLFGKHLDPTSKVNDYSLVLYIELQVNTPTPNMWYPSIYPSFYNLGVSIPSNLLLYSNTTDAYEYTLPFHSPESVLFDTRLMQGSEMFANQSIVQHVSSSNNTTNRELHAIFPKSGEWLVYLYAGKYTTVQKSSNDQKGAMVNKEPILELKVNAQAFNDSLAFPQIFDPFYTTFSMRLDKGQCPLTSRVSQFPCMVTIEFYSPPNVEFWHGSQLSTRSEANSVTRLNSDRHSGLCTLSVEITERGQWIVTINARMSEEQDSQRWTAVLMHTIQAV